MTQEKNDNAMGWSPSLMRYLNRDESSVFWSPSVVSDLTKPMLERSKGGEPEFLLVYDDYHNVGPTDNKLSWCRTGTGKIYEDDFFDSDEEESLKTIYFEEHFVDVKSVSFYVGRKKFTIYLEVLRLDGFGDGDTLSWNINEEDTDLNFEQLFDNEFINETTQLYSIADAPPELGEYPYSNDNSEIVEQMIKELHPGQTGDNFDIKIHIKELNFTLVRVFDEEFSEDNDKIDYLPVVNFKGHITMSSRGYMCSYPLSSTEIVYTLL